MVRTASTYTVLASIISFAVLPSSPAAPKNPALPVVTPVPNDDLAAPATGANLMLGTFVGPFGSHRITVCLQNLVGQTINGYSLVAGNERAFSGSLVANDSAFEARAREPGDDLYDGSFDFIYHPDTKQLTGSWTPNDPHLETITFDLPRKNFVYDPKLGKYPQTSTRQLKTAEVENIRPDELRIMRNEIYARHGYTFGLKDMRDYFEHQDWYVPISMNVSAQLTPIEEKNAALIKRYENYGSDHYDSFGR